MGTFTTKATLQASPALIPEIADRICTEFSRDGYDYNREDLISGGVDISVTKGGFFKAILGMRTALKITLIPNGNSIEFEAGVGIFGQQAIPTAIMLFVTWPVILTQIWGMVKQSEIDDKALEIAQSVINEKGALPQNLISPPPYTGFVSGEAKFCTECGTSLPAGSKFCSNCGKPV